MSQLAGDREPLAYPAYPGGESRPPRPPLTKRMRPSHWIAVDCVVAGFAALCDVAIIGRQFPGGGAGIPLVLLFAAAVFIPLALRRRAPVLAFGTLVILGIATSGLAIAVSALIFLASALVLYTVTVETRRRTGMTALGLVLLVLVFVTVGDAPLQHVVGGGRGNHVGGALVPVALACVIAWMTGYSVRQRRRYVVTLQQQAANSAVAEERLRIARELHDVVAHSMSVIAVQAGYGQYVIDASPEGAKEALGAIQATSRDALDEMRRMLGVLRQQDGTPGPQDGAPDQQDDAVDQQQGAPDQQDDALAGPQDGAADRRDPTGGQPGRVRGPADSAAGPSAASPGRAQEASAPLAPVPFVPAPLNRAPCNRAPLAPAPGLAGLDRLISRTCGAGVRVTLEIAGYARPAPAGVDLSAYRIVQEALTNVVRHAGTGAVCAVSVCYTEAALVIRVTDDGGPHSGPPLDGISAAGTGHGIIGMRERVNLCGGTFRAGPLPAGGFQVTASLPLPPAWVAAPGPVPAPSPASTAPGPVTTAGPVTAAGAVTAQGRASAWDAAGVLAGVLPAGVLPAGPAAASASVARDGSG
jgi:signal transduction histidine kinase